MDGWVFVFGRVVCMDAWVGVCAWVVAIIVGGRHVWMGGCLCVMAW